MQVPIIPFQAPGEGRGAQPFFQEAPGDTSHPLTTFTSQAHVYLHPEPLFLALHNPA